MAQALRAVEETVGGTQIELGLNAAIVSVREQQPQILVVRPGEVASSEWDALPFGPFAPRAHRTLEIGLRAWVEAADRARPRLCRAALHFRRSRPPRRAGRHRLAYLSVGYLALDRAAPAKSCTAPHWSPWYAYFPWEDWRKASPRSSPARSSRG